MKDLLKIGFFLFVLAAHTVCTTTNSLSKLDFTHGRNVPPEYITMTPLSQEEVEFEIRVQFKPEKLYHIILDQEQTILAEGWFQTARVSTSSYTVRLKLKEGFLFEGGKTYRLCIGNQNPELTSQFSNTYTCMVDYEFVFDK